LATQTLRLFGNPGLGGCCRFQNSPLKARRGRFALTQEVAAWLAEQRKSKGTDSTFEKLQKQDKSHQN
jgi:hypothetical protein